MGLVIVPFDLSLIGIETVLRAGLKYYVVVCEEHLLRMVNIGGDGAR
jgi:hypothetical protein